MKEHMKLAQEYRMTMVANTQSCGHGTVPLEKLAIVIGSMRSGTTSLFNLLSQHPQICACHVKEPGFFSNDWVWERGIEWYKSLWDWRPGQHEVALEKSTNYSKRALFPKTVERLSATAPMAKIIYIMRNPVERFESHYTLDVAKGWREPKESRIPSGMYDDLIETSRYAKQLRPYSERFSADKILLLSFDDLRDRPTELMRRACRFLSIDSSFQFSSLTVPHASNEGRRPGEVGQLVYRFRRCLPFWSVLHQRLPPGLIRGMRSVFARRTTGNKRLSDEQRQWILDELRDDLLELEREYHFDVRLWGIGAKTQDLAAISAHRL